MSAEHEWPVNPDRYQNGGYLYGGPYVGLYRLNDGGDWVHLGHADSDGLSYTDDENAHDIRPIVNGMNGGTVVVTGELLPPDDWERARARLAEAIQPVIDLVNAAWEAIVAAWGPVWEEAAAAFERHAYGGEVGPRAISNPPGWTDPIAMIDDTLAGICMCGCGRPVPESSASVWFRSERCQLRWENRHGGGPS